MTAFASLLDRAVSTAEQRSLPAPDDACDRVGGRRLDAVRGTRRRGILRHSPLLAWTWQPLAFVAAAVGSLLPIYFVDNLWPVLVPFAFVSLSLLAARRARRGAYAQLPLLQGVERVLGIGADAHKVVWSSRVGGKQSLRWLPPGGFAAFILGGVTLVACALGMCVALFGAAVRGPGGPYRTLYQNRATTFSMFWYADIPFTWFCLASAALGVCHTSARLNPARDARQQRRVRTPPSSSSSINQLGVEEVPAADGLGGSPRPARPIRAAFHASDVAVAVFITLGVPLILNVGFGEYDNQFSNEDIEVARHLTQLVVGAIAHSWSLAFLLAFMRSPADLVAAARRLTDELTLSLHCDADGDESLLAWWAERDNFVQHNLWKLGVAAGRPLLVGVALPIVGTLYLLFRIVVGGFDAEGLIWLVPTQELFAFVLVCTAVMIGIMRKYAEMERPFTVHPQFLARLAAVPGEIDEGSASSFDRVAAALREHPVQVELWGVSVTFVLRTLFANTASLAALLAVSQVR